MKDKLFLTACVIGLFTGAFIGGSITSAIIKRIDNKKDKEALNKNIKGMAKVLEELEEALLGLYLFRNFYISSNRKEMTIMSVRNEWNKGTGYEEMFDNSMIRRLAYMAKNDIVPNDKYSDLDCVVWETLTQLVHDVKEGTNWIDEP